MNGRMRRSTDWIAAGAALDRLLPAGRVELELVGELGPEPLALREEELELEEVAEPHRLGPELVPEVEDVVLGGAQQRELGDRAVHEEVRDRVAVVRRREVLVGPIA